MSKLNIIFEDNNLLVIDKPAGLVAHEGNGQNSETLVNMLRKYLPPASADLERFGLLHRLDKDTSGLLLVAKTAKYFHYLKDLFRRRQITKEYLALVHGRLSPRRGIVQVPLSRDAITRTKFSPDRQGRAAETAYEVIDYFKSFTYLKVTPKTGRTHQIRVHLASLGYPIVGDKTYGRKSDILIDRQFLHAHRIKFIDLEGKQREFTAPLPNNLKEFLNESR